MNRWPLALSFGLVGGLVGGLAGGLGVRYFLPEAASRDSASGADDAALRALREEIATLSRRIEGRDARPGLAVAPGGSGGGAPTAGAGHEPARGSGSLASLPMTREELESIVAKATEAAVEKHASKLLEASKPVEKKKVSLAEASKELGLSGSQEDEIRRAYADANEKYLKIMAEPDGDVEALRRDVEAAKNDPVKKADLVGKMIPKIFTKLGDMMSIEAERTSRIHKALGPETSKKFDAYKIEESDLLDMDGTTSVELGDSK